jgi:ankyrin repeat protein
VKRSIYYILLGLLVFCIGMAATENAFPEEVVADASNTDTLTVISDQGAVPSSVAHATLLQAVVAGDVYATLTMVKSGVKDDERDEEGRNALLLAAESNQPEIITILTEAGDDLLARDAFGNTALHLAARANDVYTINMLVDRGIPIMAGNDKFYSPLHEAAEKGNLESVKRLVELGANPKENLSKNVYLSAYTVASLAKQWDVTAFFREAGYDLGPFFNAGCGDIRAMQEYADNNPKALKDIDDDKFRFTPLYTASTGNQPEIVKFLLTQGVTPIATADGELPQFAALRANHTEVLKVFFENGYSPDERNFTYNGYTLLITAARAGDLDMMQFLIDKGARLGYTSTHGETPLHQAVDSNQYEAAKFLLDQGFIVDVKNAIAYSALHLAAEKNNLRIAELLLDYGANIQITERRRWTPLHIAVDANHLEMVQFLLNHGADTTSCDIQDNVPLHLAVDKDLASIANLLIEKGSDPRASNQKGVTPLYLAAKNGNIDLIKKLLEAGAEVDAADEMNRTPLFLALYEDRYLAARMLAEKGASLAVQDKEGQTLMFPAARSDAADAVMWLADSGLVAQVTDAAGLTPLHVAARFGSENSVSFLIEKGADANAQDLMGQTPLHLASGRGHIMNVRMLVDKGADISIKDKEGRYALHSATLNGHWGPSQLFILRGVNVNVSDNYGDTALHMAARGGYHRTVKLLLSRGGDFTAKNKAGETPLEAVENALALTSGAVGLTPSQAATQSGQRSTIIFLQAVVIDEYRNAVERNDISFIKILITTHPDYKDTLCFGCAPVYRAAKNKNTATLRVLLEMGANPNTAALTENNKTPLHQAVESGREDLTLALLNAGALPDTPDAFGVTPLDLAKEKSTLSLLPLLEKFTTPVQ